MGLGFAVLLAMVTPAAPQCPDGTPPPCRSAAAPRPAPVPSGSIAVFPFTNRSPDSSDAFLADALPEQIVGRLARVGDLRVKSATAVNAQLRRTPDPIAAARALRVEWFVTGSIRRAGRQLNVSAELVRAATGDGAWSAPFRRPEDDLSAIEEQIAESVAVAIVGRLAPTQLSSLRRPAARHPEAYRLYLYGRAMMSRRTPEDIARATTALSEAVRLDSLFAPAWARFAQARALQVQWGGTSLSKPELIAEVRRLSDRALRLDSGLADGWAARGQIGLHTGDLELMHSAYARAIALDSLQADIQHTLGYMYAIDELWIPDVAEQHLRRAVSLDPDLRNSWRYLGLIRRNQGRLAEAEALLDTTLARGAWGLGYGERSYIRYLRGNVRGALEDLAESDRIGMQMVASVIDYEPMQTGGLLRAMYRAAQGDSTEARRLLAAAESQAGDAPFQALIAMNMALGRHAAALDLLERWRNTPESATLPQRRCGEAPCSAQLPVWSALHDPLLAPLTGSPRYQRLLAETRPRVPWLERR